MYLRGVIIHNCVLIYVLSGFFVLEILFRHAMGFNFNVACFGIELVLFDLT